MGDCCQRTAAIDAAIARGELKYPDLYADTSDWASSDGSTLVQSSNSLYVYMAGDKSCLMVNGCTGATVSRQTWTSVITLSIPSGCKIPTVYGTGSVWSTNGQPLLFVRVDTNGKVNVWSDVAFDGAQTYINITVPLIKED